MLIWVVLYTFLKKYRRNIGKIEKQKFSEYITLLLNQIDYPEHKKEKTKIMIKRILGRAIPSKWEYHTLMGILSKTLEKLKK